ncbi:hypothetical protein NE237_009625 [Protea cynaroides]|uniref:Uncharacterized protein n=1 Tax=Protea cynaroides TaxID=273540 RepID=A0A9Q0KY86_9MAGN|nr:hypothetical protein NE237_009625 [Protea cynaroides]
MVVLGYWVQVADRCGMVAGCELGTGVGWLLGASCGQVWEGRAWLLVGRDGQGAKDDEQQEVGANAIQLIVGANAIHLIADHYRRCGMVGKLWDGCWVRVADRCGMVAGCELGTGVGWLLGASCGQVWEGRAWLLVGRDGQGAKDDEQQEGEYSCSR